jgi:hypothetical protein
MRYGGCYTCSISTSMMEDLQNLVTNISLTTDLVIIAIIIALVAYGLLVGQNKLKTLALSVYVGIVLAGELGPIVARMVSLSEDSAKLILFIAPIVILEIGRKTKARGQHVGPVMTLILGLATAGLAISSGLHLLGEDTRKDILSDSSLATLIYAARLWWIAGVPLAVVGESLLKFREEH